MKKRFTEDSWRTDPRFRALVSALRSCKTQADTENFLRDIATLSELQAWSERLDVAKQLARGLSYRQVAEDTGASTTTVTRVAKFMTDGQGGYERFLKLDRRKDTEPMTAVEQLQARQSQHHHEHHEAAPREERPASMLGKYLQNN